MPGGMSGLQIREGLIDGLWWVRLPFSSANIAAHLQQSCFATSLEMQKFDQTRSSAMAIP